MRVRRSILTSHPNIYVLIETLLEVQCHTYAKIRDIKNLKKRSATVKKEASVAILRTRRDFGELSRIEYVKRVSFKFLPPHLKKIMIFSTELSFYQLIISSTSL